MGNLERIFKCVFILATLVLSLLSCSSSDDAEKIWVTNLAAVKVDGKPYQSINENVWGNENCRNIYAGVYFHSKDNIQFRLKFELLKNGALRRVWYDEILLSNTSPLVTQIFLTPNFNPVSTFTIENFVYDEAENFVSFEFSGTVFLENHIATVREISGTYTNKELKRIACEVGNHSIVYNDETFKFNSVHYIASKFTNALPQTHRYISNNGFMIDMKMEDDFWNLPLTTYPIDENTTNRIEVFHYIGPLIADQVPFILPSEWQLYTTKGSFTIEGKTHENGYKRISGKIDMEILLGPEVLYTIKGIEYSAASFEN